MYVGLALFVLIVLGGVSYLIRVPFLDVRQGDPRAVPDRVHDGQLGGGAAEGARGDGALRRAEEHRRRSCCRPATASTSTASTLYLSLASVFVAQLAGVHDDVRPAARDDADADADEQGRRRRAARGAGRARPRRSTQFDLPLEGAAILLGIDQIMDMGRTAVNVMGNCIATAVVARWEGVFDDEQMRAFARRRVQGRLMRIAVVGARRQLGAAVVHECARRHDVVAFDARRRSTSPTTRRSRRRWRGAARRHHQLRRVQRRGRRRGSSGRRAERQRVRRPRAGARRRGARRDAGALQHRLRVRRHARRAPYTEDRSRRIRGACTPRRSCSASGSRPTRRARTCCASRACSAARRAAGRRRAASPASCKTLLAGGDAAGVRGSHRLADLHRRRRARDAAAARVARAPPGLYHCVNSGRCTWLEFARELARQLGVEPRLTPVRMADVTLRARAAAVLRAVEREAARRPASTCRRGRTRWRATWRPSAPRLHYAADAVRRADQTNEFRAMLRRPPTSIE